MYGPRFRPVAIRPFEARPLKISGSAMQVQLSAVLLIPVQILFATVKLVGTSRCFRNVMHKSSLEKPLSRY